VTKPWMRDSVITDRSFRIVDFALDSDIIDGKTFEDCTIYGPAIIMPLESTTLAHNTFEADPETLFWIVPEDKLRVIGAIGLVNCTFRRCVFRRIGVAGKRELRNLFMHATDQDPV